MMTDAPPKKYTPNRQIAQQQQPMSSPINSNPNNTTNSPPVQYNTKVKPHQNEFEPRPNRDMMFLRKQRLKAMLDEEMEEYKFELVSRGNIKYTRMTDDSVNMKQQPVYQQPSSFIASSSSSPSLPSVSSMNTQSPSPYLQSNAIPVKANDYNDYTNKYYPEPQPNYYYKQPSNSNNEQPTRDPYPKVRTPINNNHQMGYSEFDVNKELDHAIKKYADNLDKLKVDEFMSRKQIQDDLLKKINSKLVKINHEMNDKIYQENIAEQWINRNAKSSSNNNNTNVNDNNNNKDNKNSHY